MLACARDHLQRPPVPETGSLFSSIARYCQEHKVGIGIFRNCKCVFHLHKMMCFKDELLKGNLSIMRTLGGAALTSADWLAVNNRDTHMLKQKKSGAF